MHKGAYLALCAAYMAGAFVQARINDDGDVWTFSHAIVGIFTIALIGAIMFN